MAPLTHTGPLSHQALALQRAIEFQDGVRHGLYVPYVWPWDALGIFVVIAYMLAPPNKSRIYFVLRYPVFLICSFWCLHAIFYCRSYSPPAGYGIGIINSFAIAWMAFHILWRDTRTQSKLLLSKASITSGEGPLAVAESDKATGRDAFGSPSPGLRKRDAQDTSARHNDPGSLDDQLEGPQCEPETQHLTFYWQSLPATFTDRLAWVLTMILSLRGEGTTHGIAVLPSAPPHVHTSLARNHPNTPTPPWLSEPRSPLYAGTSRASNLSYFTLLYLRTYLLLDLAKTLIDLDPYSAGLAPIDSPLPSRMTSLLPASLATYGSDPGVAHLVRLLICILGILSLLPNLTALIPLLGYGALDARPHHWLWPSLFGSDYLLVADTGVAGWWGLWWHQMFRLAFEAPARALCGVLRLPPNSGAGRVLAVLVAFGISACLHAAGSYTLLGDTRPWGGSGMFFLVQPVAVLAEMGIKMGMESAGLSGKMPRWLARLVTFAWVHVWLYYTAPLLADDVAKGGVWLTEPVPVSIISGLRGHGWVKWDWWMLPRWHVGERWWQTGIAF